MRAVIQRVLRASVTVEGNKVSAIEKGLCVLVGIRADDTSEDCEYIAKKILKLRLFGNSEGKMWSQSVSDLDLPILSVSQFTLYATTSKGTKPDFHLAMKSEESKALYEEFLSFLRMGHSAERIFDGVFGAMMQVEIINDGPVTIIIDSKERK